MCSSDLHFLDYNKMPSLSRKMVELKLPNRPGKKPIKQIPRRFAPQILPKIKEEIERLLKYSFIRTARYVDWLPKSDEFDVS